MDMCTSIKKRLPSLPCFSGNKKVSGIWRRKHRFFGNCRWRTTFSRCWKYTIPTKKNATRSSKSCLPNSAYTEYEKTEVICYPGGKGDVRKSRGHWRQTHILSYLMNHLLA